MIRNCGKRLCPRTLNRRQLWARTVARIGSQKVRTVFRSRREPWHGSTFMRCYTVPSHWTGFHVKEAPNSGHESPDKSDGDADREFVLAQSCSYFRISLDAIENNLKLLMSLCAGNTEVIAVVKGNALGHGDVGVASYLSGRGVKNFAVATAHEGRALRLAGLKDTILVMGNFTMDSLQLMLTHRLVPTVSCVEAVDAWASSSLQCLGGRHLTQHPVIIKVDSGLKRYGCKSVDLRRVIERCSERDVPIHSVMTHLSEPWFTGVTSYQEMERFLQVTSTLRSAGLKVHAAATGPVLQGLGADFDYIRPGAGLYGLLTDASLASGEYNGRRFQPALSWLAKPGIVKTVKRGQRVGYFGLHTMEEDGQIAVLTAGYADGYRSALSNVGHVSDLKGRSYPTIGHINMDSLMIKASDDVTEDTIFHVIKDDFTSSNSVMHLSRKLNMTPIEFCAHLSNRLPRVFISENGLAYATTLGPSQSCSIHLKHPRFTAFHNGF